MTKNLKQRMALGATAMGVVLSTPAFAQEAADTSGSDIVVTARRVEERLALERVRRDEDRAIVESCGVAEAPPASAEHSVGSDLATLQFRRYYYETLRGSAA